MTVQQKILLLLNEFHALGIDKQIGYNKFYLYSLITHSTAIEGSTVTEIENQLLFDEGISARGRSMDEQLMNLDLKAAYEQSILYAESHSDISVDILKHLASIVMKNTAVFNTALGSFSSSNGDLRLLNVTAGVGGKSYMNYSKVPSKLIEFCVDVNGRRKTINENDIIEAYNLSFDAHFQLVTIHPWADGNGRMSRLLMNQLQYEFGLVPTKIEKQNKAKYIETLIATRESGDLQVFRDFMLHEHMLNLERIIQEYESSINDDHVPTNVPVNVPVKLTARQTAIVHEMMEDKHVSAKNIAGMLAVSEKAIRRDIDYLKKNERIARIGSDKSGEWKVLLK